jgi:hypothetical protein
MAGNGADLMPLALRPNCECCDRDLPNGDPRARICTFECTFCSDCAEQRLAGVCPNCGGDLVLRPTRPDALLGRHPASRDRVRKPHPACLEGAPP